jgi:SulP family sulfate permease
MSTRTSSPNHWAADLTAGLTTAIANIPDAMASAILAGTNPVYGLYGLMSGTPVGALITSSQFMSVAVTSAMALMVGSALADVAADDQTAALFTLTLLVGVLGILAGLLRLGRLMRYVSNSVMVGFLTGVSVLIILSQLGDFTGYSSDYSNKVAKAVDLLLHPTQADLKTLAIGVLTVVIILALNRTRLSNFSMLFAMVLASAAVLLVGWDSVQTVGDIADIPSSLPLPQLPDLSLVPILLLPALSLTIVALVQGAGVSKSYANPDGRYPDVSRDFVGEGAANLAASLFQGMPLGGSVGTTALNVSAGAKTRWANVFSGLFIVVVVLLFARAVSFAAMPAMAALLIVAGIQSLKVEDIRDVWDVGMGPRAVMLVTFGATLVLPVQHAVFVGVVLSALVYFFSAADDVEVVHLGPTAEGQLKVQEPPAELPSRAATLLQIRGNLFYAAVDRIEALLPTARQADYPVVILGLLRQEHINSTFINLLERYDEQLKASRGKLMLAGVSQHAKEQLDRTETTDDLLGEENIFESTEILGESGRAAYRAAQDWLEGLEPEDIEEIKGKTEATL